MVTSNPNTVRHISTKRHNASERLERVLRSDVSLTQVDFSAAELCLTEAEVAELLPVLDSDVPFMRTEAGDVYCKVGGLWFTESEAQEIFSL